MGSCWAAPIWCFPQIRDPFRTLQYTIILIIWTTFSNFVKLPYQQCEALNVSDACQVHWVFVCSPSPFNEVKCLGVSCLRRFRVWGSTVRGLEGLGFKVEGVGASVGFLVTPASKNTILRLSSDSHRVPKP